MKVFSLKQDQKNETRKTNRMAKKNKAKKKKKLYLILAIVLIVLILILLALFNKKPQEEYSTVLVSRSDLKQTVSETGIIKAASDLDLSFLNPGRVSELYVELGDQVEAGQLLAVLDQTSLELRRQEAEAGLEIARANLSKIISGASQESININQSELNQVISAESSARIDLEKTKISVAENIKQAEKALFDLESKDPSNITPQEQAVISAESALQNTKTTQATAINDSKNLALLTLNDKILVAQVALDNLNNILKDDDAKYLLGVLDSSTLPNTKRSFSLALEAKQEAQSALNLAKDSREIKDVERAGFKVRDLLYETSLSLSNAYTLLEASIYSANFPKTKLDSYKNLLSAQSNQVALAISSVESVNQALQNSQLAYTSSVSGAEENLNQARASLNNAIILARNNLNSARLNGEQQIISAQARLDNAVNNVALVQAKMRSLLAPAQAQDLALAEAQVKQAQASLDSIEKQLLDTQLIAPLSGVITQINFLANEQFMVGVLPMMKILTDNNFEIELDISESDISKLRVGNLATVTLDAFGEELEFEAELKFIEPAQTIIQGVVYYKVNLEFAEQSEVLEQLLAQDLNLKAGMTANVDIISNKREQVLQIPARALLESSNSQRLVRVLKNGTIEERSVQIGLRGDDGLVEIISGLEEGEEVVTFIKILKP